MGTMTGRDVETSAPGRVWDAQRQAQGFRSQAHLDAFYVHVDHERACAECGQPGPAVWLEGDASWQPTSAQCETGRALFLASYSENFAPAAAVTAARRLDESAERLARYARGDVGYRLLG